MYGCALILKGLLWETLFIQVDLYRGQESLTKQAEERTQSAENELKEAKSKILKLEGELRAVEASLKQQLDNKLTASSHRQKTSSRNVLKKTTAGSRRN